MTGPAQRLRGLRKAFPEALTGILDSLAEGIYIQDREGRFLYVNQGAARMYGSPRADLLGKTPADVAAPGRNDLETLRRQIIAAFEGHPQRFLFWGLRADGTPLPKDVHLYPSTYFGQEVVVAVAQDVSARLRAEQVREAAFRVAESALAATDLPQLFASVHAIVQGLIPAENLYIAIHDPATQTVSFPYWVDACEATQPTRPFGRGLTEFVLRTGQAQLVDPPRLHELLAQGEIMGSGPESLAWLGIPLHGTHGIFGVLAVQSYAGGYRYTSDDLELLTFVSGQVAMAIERKRMEASLRLTHAAVDQAQDGVFGMERSGRFIFVNDAACDGLGYRREELLALRVMDINPTLTLESWDREWEALRRGESRVLEVVQRRKNGSWRTVEITRSLFAWEGKEVLFSNVRDITDRKQSEMALRQSEQRLWTVLKHSQAIVYQLDPEGRFLISEGLGLAELGLQPGQVVGMSAFDLYRDDPPLVEQLRRAIQGEGSRTMTHAAGRIFDNTLTPVFDEADCLESVIGIALDMTAQQETQQALLEERGLFVGGPVMVIRWRNIPGWPVDYISPNVQSILGYSAEDLTSGRIRYSDLIHPEDLERFHEDTRHPHKGGATHFEQEYRLRLANGTYHWFYDFTGPSASKPQSPLLLGYLLDITERRQAEEALRQAQKLESLGVLAGGIAHDFNNLLTSILGNLNLAQLQLPEGNPAHGYLENMEKGILRAAELTKQMLAYSGRGRFVVKSHDLNAVVRELAHLLEVSISKKVALHFDLDPHLPAIEADAAQIQQVAMNLVTNASDAIGDREGHIRISTRRVDLAGEDLPALPGQALAPGTYVVLEVEDTGCGMSPEVLERIFDPFFTTKTTGRGLGLSALMGILRGHHAGLRINSQPGEGSVFRLYFPASQFPGSAPELAMPDLPEARWQGQVLLVDDEEMVLETIGHVLEAMGFRVVTARDGQAALDAVDTSSARFDLVLMDLTMPRMDGREAFQAMRLRNPGLRVILCSGYTEQDILQTFGGDAPEAFIQKPYTAQELRRTIQRVMGEP